MHIRRASLCDLRVLSEFAHERNQFTALRGRPFLLTDSLEDIEVSYKAYIEEDSKAVLMQYEGDELIGITGVFWLIDDLYLQLTRGIFAKDSYHTVAYNFIDYLQETFPGYKLYSNSAKEHVCALEFYDTQGFQKLEDAVLYQLKDLSKGNLSEGIEEINEHNKDTIFNYLEGIMTENTYWNVERLRANLSKFIIIAYYNEGIKGVLYAQIYKRIDQADDVEIMCVVSDSNEITQKLFTALTFKCQALKVDHILLYTEDPSEVALAIELNYSYFDSNVCYLKTL